MAGVNFGDTQGDVTIGGDVVGRDKIVNNIQNLYERTLTAVEAAAEESAFEAKRLAQGVSAFVQRLHSPHLSFKS
jgi:hypothetical protein